MYYYSIKEKDTTIDLQLQLTLKIAELAARSAEFSQAKIELTRLQDENLIMEQELLYFKRIMFGKKSERFIPPDPAQLCLNFNAQEQL